MTIRSFYVYLENAKQYSTKSIRCYEKGIWLWEEFSVQDDFALFNKQKAIDFKSWLKSKKKKHGEGNVSLSYCYNNIRYLKSFFVWLSKQDGYKSKVHEQDVEYLNLTKAENRIATQSTNTSFPSIDQVKTVIEHIEGNTEVEMRDKALISLNLLTGIRISALASLSLQCFDKKTMIIDQNPKLGVKTKFSKRITSVFVPIPYKKAQKYFMEWVEYLEVQKGFKPVDPIFPATKTEVGKKNLGFYSNGEVEATFWKSTTSLRKIFEKRFKQAGVTYFHPHTFRNLLVSEISKLPLTEIQKKAFSQNLGHENVGTTFGSYGYGHIDSLKQARIIQEISFNNLTRVNVASLSKEELLKFVAQRMD
ncbi:site-specific integrase [Patescibacteria group bacterium]|nr:site-specific integrase [Patescibacteria group bacterium]MBU1721877.1 site-specific integrase [Patescibacteria group bacterium]MBU1901335.1 site-specific integrase [Patescibacteria group bacterium]